LRRQIRNNTLSPFKAPPLYPGNLLEDIWLINITDVQIGALVIGLTWAAVGCMCVNMILLTQVLMSGIERERGRKFSWNMWNGTNSKAGNRHGQEVEMDRGVV
jgi:hypothetical protein